MAEEEGLTSFPFPLNLSSSVHRLIQLISLTQKCVLELLKLSFNVNECKPLPRRSSGCRSGRAA